MSHQPKYDAAERERVRRDLLAYKLAFKIGAPRLASLISDAHPLKPLVDHRRVARFLAKQTHPDEAFLGWCDLFLKSCPETHDTVWHLAQGLLRFYGHHEGWDYTGEYVIYSPAKVESGPPAGQVSITQDEKFWRVVTRGNNHQITDGVLINLALYGMILTIDRLTGAGLSSTVAGGPAGISGHALPVDMTVDNPAFSFRLEKRHE